MKKSIAMAWVSALESGEYEQGTGRLRDANNNWCCLGVLCNLHAQAKPRLAAQQEDVEGYFGEMEFTPQIVQEWSGLKSGSGEFVEVHKDDYGETDTWKDELTNLNDSGKDFNYIAKVIRKHYKEL